MRAILVHMQLPAQAFTLHPPMLQEWSGPSGVTTSYDVLTAWWNDGDYIDLDAAAGGGANELVVEGLPVRYEDPKKMNK